MLIDIITVTLIFIFCIIGIRTGFLRGILSFVTIFASIIIAIFLARPIARVLDSWFNLAETAGNWFTGDGNLDTMARNNGLIVLTVFSAIFVFALIRIILWLLRKRIRRLKEDFHTFNRVDQLFGFFFGLFRFIFYTTIVSTFLLVASSLTFLEWLPNWLFEDSTVAYWIYQQCITIMAPLLRLLNPLDGN